MLITNEDLEAMTDDEKEAAQYVADHYATHCECQRKNAYWTYLACLKIQREKKEL